jgi:hypothetical protein
MALQTSALEADGKVVWALRPAHFFVFDKRIKHKRTNHLGTLGRKRKSPPNEGRP